MLAGGMLLAASVVFLFGYFRAPQAAEQADRPPSDDVIKPPAGAALVGPLKLAAVRQLDAGVALVFDGRRIATTWRTLGLVVDEVSIASIAARLAASGVPPLDIMDDYFSRSAATPVPVVLDRTRALEVVVDYKDAYDRPATDARLDLEHRTVLAEADGFGIDAYASLVGIEEAARSGMGEVALAGAVLRPRVTRAALGDLDISTVMASFETHYPVAEKDRNYNLKLAAEHLNGKVLMPGELFSFNEVVGDRTEKQGYRVAHVISAGEMIDGLAGGACQISSTLHGAAWFSGLELVGSRPHSRPSAYITMGLDATVVYPSTDLKLRNPYDFPVAIHYTVSRGTVRAEILGKPRPFDRIAFERKVIEEKPYETITREDNTMPVGSTLIEQVGFPGYRLIRRRVFYKDGKEVKSEKWPIVYPPTTEYIRVGTNPNPNLKPPQQPKPHGPMNPGGPTYELSQ